MIPTRDARDPINPRSDYNAARDMRDAGGIRIDNWTVISASAYTGYFSAAVNTTLVGIGSQVFIKPYNQAMRGEWYTITAITSTGNSAAAPVTLDRAAPAGYVEALTYKYDFATCPVGVKMPAGILLGAATDINDTSGELLLVEVDLQD